MWVKVLHSICNMGTRGLPDMHARTRGPPDMPTPSPRARGPQGTHTRQTPTPMLQTPNGPLAAKNKQS